MGYDIKRFASEVDQNLICGICLSVYDNPKTLSSCQHIFCFTCIEKNVINGNECPIDKNHIDSSNIEEAPEYIVNYVSALKIKCDFFEFGCKETVPLSQLLLHRLNCEFHPERKVKCKDCGLETEKIRFKDHNCVNILKSRLDLMGQQLDSVYRLHSKQISILKSQLQRRNQELNGKDSVNVSASDRQVISFSCISDTQSGTHEIIYIQTYNLTLQCEACMQSKVRRIKYTAASVANLNTTDFSLFSNGLKLEDENSLRSYGIHSGMICHLLPNEIYITFDCLDIKQIFGVSVRTNDKVKTIIEELHSEIEKLIPEQLFKYLKQCSCCLYFNEQKLEESYRLANYDVLSMRTLRYCNRLPIDV